MVEERIRSGIASALLGWTESGLRSFPWREEGLSSYQVLVAELLLKRTTATAAARTYRDFIDAFPTIPVLAEASLLDVARVLKPIGLYNQRATSMKSMARYLVETHSGAVPSDFEALLKIPGVGQYTARAVLLCAFNQPVALVDSNVQRVLTRLTSTTALTGKQFQALADSLLPARGAKEYNWGLLDLGSEVCRYDYPRCSRCPLTDWCSYRGGPSEERKQDSVQ